MSGSKQTQSLESGAGFLCGSCFWESKKECFANGVRGIISRKSSINKRHLQCRGNGGVCVFLHVIDEAPDTAT